MVERRVIHSSILPARLHNHVHVYFPAFYSHGKTMGRGVRSEDFVGLEVCPRRSNGKMSNGVQHLLVLLGSYVLVAISQDADEHLLE